MFHPYKVHPLTLTQNLGKCVPATSVGCTAPHTMLVRSGRRIPAQMRTFKVTNNIVRCQRKCAQNAAVTPLSQHCHSGAHSFVMSPERPGLSITSSCAGRQQQQHACKMSTIRSLRTRSVASSTPQPATGRGSAVSAKDPHNFRTRPRPALQVVPPSLCCHALCSISFSLTVFPDCAHCRIF